MVVRFCKGKYERVLALLSEKYIFALSPIRGTYVCMCNVMYACVCKILITIKRCNYKKLLCKFLCSVREIADPCQ